MKPNKLGITPLISHIERGNIRIAKAIKDRIVSPKLLDLRGAAIEAGEKAGNRGDLRGIVICHWTRLTFNIV
jgi:hypothetical protein